LPDPTGHPRIEGTARLEAFSDGVMAIIVTLLIFEIHVPNLSDLSTAGVLKGLLSIATKLVSFAVSFFTLAIYWVNHHYFFSRITHTDWKLLWWNNSLLFWLTIVPFTTDFLGDYPLAPLVVMIYSLTLLMAAISFTLMGYYVFFQGLLVPESLPMRERRHEFRRSLLGCALYGSAGLLAFIYTPAALAILTMIPFLYVIPYLMRET
jgi:uncharacterized membrane protein